MDETISVLDAEITGIKFGLASHKEICTASVSECPITHASQLGNPFLGLPLEVGKCESCGTAEPGQCEGHFGYIELPIPVYHSCHVGELKRLLSVICLKCLKLKNRKLQLKKSIGMVDKLLAACCEEASQISIKDIKTADGAYYLQLKVPSKVVRDGIWNFLGKYGFRYGDGRTRTLLPVEALEILKRIPTETKRKLAGKGYFPQDGYILKYLPVPPNCLSVPDVSDGISVMSSDQSSSLLRKVLKQVETIRNSRLGTPNFESHEVEANDLQSAIEHYLEVRGTAKTSHERDTRYGISKESSDSSTKAWLEKMKTLFIRKGSGFSSRSVITGDAYKGVSELGLPYEIAQRITFEERVNEYNLAYLQGLVDQKLCLTYKDGNATYSLREGSKGHTLLRPGQIVNRRIMDGDVVFINRPPTTHKHSLQALSVYVHEDHTVKINPLICGPLSADFDGDCVHLFYPQSLSAKAEVLELFSVEKQLPSSHTGSLNLQLATDSLLSLKMLFKSFFTSKAHAQQLAMFASSPLPQPAIVKGSSVGPLWTAPQILQSTLPTSFDCVGDRFRICKSEFLWMDLNRDSLPSLVNEIVTSIFTEKGPKPVLDFFDHLQPMLMEHLCAKGFSVSLEDFLIPVELARDIHRDIDEMSKLLLDIRSVDNELLEVQLESNMRILKALVSKSMLKLSSLGDLIDAKSDSANLKVVQQVGFLGPQLSHKGKFYTRTLVEDLGCMFDEKYPRDVDYPTARYGLIKNSFCHGLDPYEGMIHSVSSREVMVRSSRGLTEPGTLFKNLMAVLRDVVICYDGTVRNVCSNSVIQFDYSGKSKSKNLFQAGEPVGVLAATAISNPAYKAVLDSSTSSNSSWDLMKEILLCKTNFKNDLNDRRAILYLNECDCGKPNCQERAAYLVQNHLRKISLKDAAVEFLIEYLNPQTTTDISNVDGGLTGHIHLNKELMNKFSVSIQEIHLKCQETINCFPKKKPVGQILKNIFLFTRECCPCEGKWSGMPCLMFFWKDASDSHLERTSRVLSDIIYPILLETVIKGDPRISSANIIWISPDTTTWIRNPSRNRTGELAMDVVLKKASVKCSGDAWRILLDSCLPVLHLIDTSRSVPYAIKQVQELLGISCAFEQAVQRLSRSVTTVSKGILKEHLILLANTMTCSGSMVGFTKGGYKALCRTLDIQVPFTEATQYTPKKCFERAAEKCHTDSLSSIVASCSWGKSVAVGTGSGFEILLNTNEMAMKQLADPDVYSFLQLVSAANGVPGTDCLGADVDYLPDESDIAMSPEHDPGSSKPTFDENDGPQILETNDGSDATWDNIPACDNAGWGVAKSQCDDSSLPAKTSAWSSWGSDKAVARDASYNKEEVDSSAWGKKVESQSVGWGDAFKKAGDSSSWNKSSDWTTGALNGLASSTEADGWGKKPAETTSGGQWGVPRNQDDSSLSAKAGAWSGWGSDGCCDKVENSSSSWGKKVVTETQPVGWVETTKKSSSSSPWNQSGEHSWENKREAPNITDSGSWAVKASETKISGRPWGTAKEAVTSTDSDHWGKKTTETNSGGNWGAGNTQSKNDASQSAKPSAWSSWGSDKAVPHDGTLNTIDNSSSSWGNKVVTESQSPGWGQGAKKAGNCSSWNQSGQQSWRNAMETVDRADSGSWAPKSAETNSSEQPWGTSNEVASTTEPDGWGMKATEVNSGQWGGNAAEKNSVQWGKNAAEENSAQWGKKAAEENSTQLGKMATEDNSGQRGKKAAEEHSGQWGKKVSEATENDTNSQWNSPRPRATSESEGIQWGQRSGFKRNRQDLPSGQLSRPPKPVVQYSTEEQEILLIVEPMLERIRKILHDSGYNDGDPISAEDKAYLLEEVLNHHPNKAEKIGVGVENILINRHNTYRTSRCFYVVRPDGRQEDFSTRKCLQNLVEQKFPDLAKDFSIKFFPAKTNKEREKDSNNPAAADTPLESAAGTPHETTPAAAADTPESAAE